MCSAKKVIYSTNWDVTKNPTDLLIDKALCPSDEEHLLRSAKGVMFKN